MTKELFYDAVRDWLNEEHGYEIADVFRIRPYSYVSRDVYRGLEVGFRGSKGEYDTTKIGSHQYHELLEALV